MLSHYYVRLGLFGHVGRLTARSNESFVVGRRAVCRTARGLEVGSVLRAATSTPGISSADVHADGQLLRHVTPEDDLLLARLERNRAEAYDQCVRLLDERGISATLVDVEHLFDGRTLFFYFLGAVTPQIDALTRDLADAYETKVKFREFADAVTRGCGPNCGSDAAAGCGTDGCADCAIASACGNQQ